MMGLALQRRVVVGLLAALVSVGGGVEAASPKDNFYKGYYLETAQGDFAGAAEAYGEVVADRGADARLKAKAQAGLDRVREELACTDFASLMPSTALAYFEFNQPGDQLIKLIDQLGLLADEDQSIPPSGQRVSISPALIKEVLGVRGAAVAITAFDPVKQTPAGVAVFHPGNMQIIRGLIETGLPIASRMVEPIGGFATYDIEGEVLVTLTSRLVVASPQRSQIEGVLRRLRGDDRTSLATNKDLAEVLKDRDDSLLFFCINAKPILPMVNGLLAAGAMHSPELAMARAVLDVNSFQSLVGRAGVGDDGISFDVTLRLDEGHRNLVYNLLRTPSVSRETLKSVPSGAAGFFVGALNEKGSRYTAQTTSQSGAPPVVTALDFGREFFANITSFAVCALRPQGVGGGTGSPIPDIAAVISVNDPARSEALWTQVLGIAGLAAGGRAIEGTPVEIEGVTARSYQFSENVSIYFAISGDDVLLSTTRDAMARSIQAQRKGDSILDDAAFATSLSRVGPDTTQAFFVHPGRALQIAKPFMSAEEAAEIGPFLSALSDTVASIVVDHADGAFRFSTEVTGIPRVGELVTQLIEREKGRHQANASLAKATSAGRWGEALSLADDLLSNEPDCVDLLSKKFHILSVGQEDHVAARACGDKIYEANFDDAKALNNFAWALLTEDQYNHAYNELALKLSQRSNELTDLGSWGYVDTLALAKFETADVEKAVELEKKAIELSGGRGVAGLQAALARFEKGLQDNKVAEGER